MVLVLDMVLELVHTLMRFVPHVSRNFRLISFTLNPKLEVRFKYIILLDSLSRVLSCQRFLCISKS